MRPGDFHLPGDARNRWGNIVQLNTSAGAPNDRTSRKSAAFVETPVFDEPALFQIELRVAGADGVFSPFVTGTGFSLRVRIRRAIDRDKGIVEDIYTLEPPTTPEPTVDSLPVSCVIAQQLGMYVEIAGDANKQVTVEIVVTRVSACSCCGLQGGSSTGYSGASQARFPMVDPFIAPNFETIMAANSRRAQFFIQNNSPVDLMVSMSVGANATFGSEFGFVLLPGGISAIYESPLGGYNGPVSIAWRPTAEDATAFALVSEGKH
jgi:hypothetical protein